MKSIFERHFYGLATKEVFYPLMLFSFWRNTATNESVTNRFGQTAFLYIKITKEYESLNSFNFSVLLATSSKTVSTTLLSLSAGGWMRDRTMFLRFVLLWITCMALFSEFLREDFG